METWSKLRMPGHRCAQSNSVAHTTFFEAHIKKNQTAGVREKKKRHSLRVHKVCRVIISSFSLYYAEWMAQKSSHSAGNGRTPIDLLAHTHAHNTPKNFVAEDNKIIWWLGFDNKWFLFFGEVFIHGSLNRKPRLRFTSALFLTKWKPKQSVIWKVLRYNQEGEPEREGERMI